MRLRNNINWRWILAASLIAGAGLILTAHMLVAIIAGRL